MFGWMLVREREVDLEAQMAVLERRAVEAELAKAKEYIATCERVIDIERGRVQQERERADRLNDAILQQNGLPNVTSTGLTEAAIAEEKQKDIRDEQLRQFAEISADQLGNAYDAWGIELPPELGEQVKELIGK